MKIRQAGNHFVDWPWRYRRREGGGCEGYQDRNVSTPVGILNGSVGCWDRFRDIIVATHYFAGCRAEGEELRRLS